MKQKLLTIALVATLPFLNLRSEEPTVHISENFNSPAWQEALLTQDPAYVKPSPGGNYGVVTGVAYLDKYFMEGAFVTLGINDDFPTLDCALFAETSTVHTDENGQGVSFRLRNSGTSYLEFPEIPNAGKITLHVRNGNKTVPTTMKLQRYEMETWTDVKTFDLLPNNDFKNSAVDEIITFEINSPVPVKLRLSRGDKFIMIFQVDIEAYTPTAVKTANYAGFKITNRTLTTETPTRVSIYTIQGKLVYEVDIQNSVELPAGIDEGLFILKSKEGIQKIQIR